MTSESLLNLLEITSNGEMPSRLRIENLIPPKVKSLDFGCGSKKLQNSLGIDASGSCLPDLIHDIDRQPLPIQDNSFDLIYSDQFLEHVENLIFVMSEAYRVLRPGGIMISRVPYFRSSYAYIDPTHRRCFTINTLDYFVDGNYLSDNYSLSEFKFSAIYKFIESPLDSSYLKSFLARFLKNRALKAPHRFENSFWSTLFPFSCITFCLVK